HRRPRRARPQRPRAVCTASAGVCEDPRCRTAAAANGRRAMSPLATRPRAVIETAGPDDAGAVAAIHARSLAAAWSEDEFSAFIEDPGVIALVMRVARRLGRPQVAGFIICRSAANEAEVLSVATDPAYRSKGYGRSLIEEAMRRLYRDRIE